MIEPSGTPIHLPPNRQTKVPGLGTNQTATRQSIMPGCSNSQAQDDAGYGSIGLGGITDNMPGRTQRLDTCAYAAQDSGSNAAGFMGVSGNLNVGASNTPGKTAIDGTSPEIRSTKAAALHNVTGNKEMSVHPGALFPGIHD